MTAGLISAQRIGVNLLVLTRRPPGGTGYYAINLFEALIAAECDDSASVRIDGFAEEGAERYFSELARNRLVLLPSGTGFTRIVNEMLRLPLAARQAGVDIMINPAFLGVPWGSPRRATVIHDLYFRIAGLIPLRRRMLLRALVPPLARRSDSVIVDSHATKADLAHFYPHLVSKAEVVHCGNRDLRVRGDVSRPAYDRPFLLMVGAMTANKAPETVIAALASLRREGRDIMLVHIGDDLGRIVPAAERAGVAASIVLLGRQPDDVLAAHYRYCEALVLPSIREGFGLPLIEAQAQGAPVIASSCDALVEVGEDSVLYFPVENAEKCAEAIRGVLDDPEQRRVLVDRGSANAARFRWDRTAQRLIEVLKV